MRIGVVIEETWGFFHEIYAELQNAHQTSLFRRRNLQLPFFEDRVNRYLFHHDLQHFLRSNQVVLFEWASELLLSFSRLPKTCGMVTRLHRYEMYQWAEQINWDVVDRVILVSQAKQREFNRLFPQQSHKVVVIPEAISLEKFKPHPKQFEGNIGILCHLTPRKRVYELILAFSELLQLRDSFHLHIGGGAHVLHGDYYQAMQFLVQRLNLLDKVTFYGNVTDTDVWHRNIDIFISNSYSEGLQVSPMEAAGSGCYCLSHNWDGADELLPADDLYMTDRELIDKILVYADSSPQMRDEKREAQLNLVRERFDVDKSKLQIRKILEEVGSNWT